MTPQRTLDPVWSPDSRWIAYSKKLPSQMHAVFAYSLEQAKSLQLTDGLSRRAHPAFDRKDSISTSSRQHRRRATTDG